MVQMWKITSLLLLCYLSVELVIFFINQTDVEEIESEEAPPLLLNGHEIVVKDEKEDLKEWFLQFNETHKDSDNSTICLRNLQSANLTGSPQMVLYTIIPKAASTTFFGLIKQVTLIQGRYHFNHFPSYKMLRHNDLLNEMPYDQFISLFGKPPCPKVTGSHEPFVDFQDITNSENPLYISLVRDPLTQTESYFYEKRLSGDPSQANATFRDCLFHEECSDIKRACKQFMYFCGRAPVCQDSCGLTNKEKVRDLFKRTVANVEQFYSVILVMEQLRLSLRVLETKLPQFFAGISKIYNKDDKKKENKDYQPIQRSLLHRKLYCEKQPLECQLYEFLQQKMKIMIQKTL